MELFTFLRPVDEDLTPQQSHELALRASAAMSIGPLYPELVQLGKMEIAIKDLDPSEYPSRTPCHLLENEFRFSVTVDDCYQEPKQQTEEIRDSAQEEHCTGDGGSRAETGSQLIEMTAEHLDVVFCSTQEWHRTHPGGELVPSEMLGKIVRCTAGCRRDNIFHDGSDCIEHPDGTMSVVVFSCAQQSILGEQLILEAKQWIDFVTEQIKQPKLPMDPQQPSIFILRTAYSTFHYYLSLHLGHHPNGCVCSDECFEKLKALAFERVLDLYARSVQYSNEEFDKQHQLLSDHFRGSTCGNCNQVKAAGDSSCITN